MDITLTIGIITGLAGVLGAAIGGGTSIFLQRIESARREAAFRREALDRFRRDRLKAYSALAKAAIRTSHSNIKGLDEPMDAFVETFWTHIYLLEHEDYLRLREHIQRIVIARATNDTEKLNMLLIEIRAFTGRSAAYQAIWYESELRGEAVRSREDVENELTEKARKLVKSKSSALWKELGN